MAKVLLASDTGPPHTWSLLRRFLQSAGHDVAAVHDGESVLAALPTDQPEVLILDTALPILDGFQVLARLQQQATPTPVPVVVISSIAAQVGSQLAATLGASAYLCKPFTFEALEQALHQALGTAPGGPPSSGLGSALWQSPAPVPPEPRALPVVANRRRRGAS